MPRHRLLALALLAALSGPAAAQVVRCTDAATGRTTYTDGDCGRAETAREVLPPQSVEEIARERQQAAEAVARKRERQQREAAEQLAQEQRNPPRPAAPAPTPSQSPQCLQARQQLQQLLAVPATGLHDDALRLQAAERQADQACLTPEEFARAERQRGQAPTYLVPARVRPPHWRPPPPAPPPQREITHCNVFRCYDRQGNIYPR